MSFGFGVGDFLATLHNVKRIAEEVQNYRDAPRHFQQLSAELILLQNTLQCVLHIHTTDPDELANLDRIRIIAMHCHQPLRAFIDKMRPKETSLGHFRSAGTISTIGKRLHWSLITRNDVEDLRKVVVSEMVAINVLLGMQQLTYLRMLAKDDSTFREDAREYFADSKALLTKSVNILNNVETLPLEIHNLQELMVSSASKQNELQGGIAEGVSAISVNTSLIVSHSKKARERVQKIGNQVTKTMIAIASLTANIKELMILLATFSKEVLCQIAANSRKLLDIHANIKRILRAIEAVPLHLTLDLVRFDDALGESWALPFQACSLWHKFKDMLQMVVFRDQRPGSTRVALEQFIIVSVKDNSIIQPATWESTIKAGAHISQSMVVSKERTIGGVCQFPSCNEPLVDLRGSDGGYSCSAKCGRLSIIHGRTANVLQLVAFAEAKYPSIGSNQAPRPLNIEGPSLPAVQTLEDEVNYFRRIHVFDNMSPVKTIEEATALLAEDPENARALQFIAWFNFPHKNNVKEEPRKVKLLEFIIDLLERSIKSNPLDSQTWYLLGRAFMDIQQPQNAHVNFQQAIYRDDRFPGYWLSMAVLYYAMNQYRSSLDALSRSIRLNPYISEAWYNLGVLYESCDNQPEDAALSYERSLQLEEIPDPVTKTRHEYLFQIYVDGAISSKEPLPMKDVDLRSRLNQPQKVDHEEDIQIPGLNLRDSVGSEEDWSDTDFDEDEEYPNSNDGAPVSGET